MLPTATVTATRRPTARERLFAEMERLFADDAGLGALVPYNGRPDMSGQAKAVQTAWARALVAAHGRDRAASVYTEYADRRQGTVTERVGSWDNLVLATSPVPRWNRDVHGFMCFGCTDSFATVTTPEREQLCNRCAREYGDPATARPQWHAYSHPHFEFPGLVGEERTQGETLLVVQYEDGETRRYVTGEAGLLTRETTGLPGFTTVSTLTHGDSRDTISLTVQARAELGRRSAEISATFTYDPHKEDHEGHSYGFRLVTAQISARSRRLGHLDLHDPAVTEHTDLYRTIDTLISHLYGGHK